MEVRMMDVQKMAENVRNEYIHVLDITCPFIFFIEGERYFWDGVEITE